MIGIIVKNNVEKTHASMLNMLTYYEDVMARNIAYSAAEEALMELSLDSEYHTDGNWVIKQREIGGIDSVRVATNVTGSIEVDVRSRYGNSHYLIRSQFLIQEAIEPTSALGFHDQTIDFGFSGNSIVIDGNDHDLNNQVIADGEVLPAITVPTQSDANKAINASSDSNHHLLGEGGSPSVKVRNDIADPKDIIDDLEQYIDVSITQTSFSGNQTFGTSADPQNTYIKPSGSNKTVSFSGDVTAHGMLIIDGNLSTSGNFTVNGILVIKGSAEFSGDLTVNGAILVWQQYNEEHEFSVSANNIDILGAVIISGAGREKKFDISSNQCRIRYSSEAISNALSIVGAKLAYTQLKWFEQKLL